MNSSISNSKKFTIKTFAIAIVLLTVFGVASEWLLRTKVIPNDRFFQQVELFQSDIKAKILFVGDSHTSQGVDAPKGSLNIGLAGDGFEQIVAKLNLYLKRHQKPEKIILQLSPQMFASYRFEDQFRDYSFYFDAAFSKDRFVAIFDPIYKVRLSDYWKNYIKNGQFNARGEFTQQGSILIDYEMNPQITKPIELSIRKRVEQHSFDKDPVNYKTADFMLRTIKSLQDADIDVCIVTFPVTPAYREEADKKESFNKAFKFFDKITTENGVPYLNYYKAFNDYSLFRNMDHLNKLGAQQFTPILLNDCNIVLNTI